MGISSSDFGHIGNKHSIVSFVLYYLVLTGQQGLNMQSELQHCANQ